jgi:hypothetical protein
VLTLVIGLALAILVLVLLPLVVVVLELVALAVGVYLLGKPWIIEAETAGPPAELKSWRDRGWRRSRRAVEEVARELRAGVAAEPDEAEPALSDVP